MFPFDRMMNIIHLAILQPHTHISIQKPAVLIMKVPTEPQFMSFGDKRLAQ